MRLRCFLQSLMHSETASTRPLLRLTWLQSSRHPQRTLQLLVAFSGSRAYRPIVALITAACRPATLYKPWKERVQHPGGCISASEAV